MLAITGTLRADASKRRASGTPAGPPWRQVDDGVGRAAQRHVDGDRVVEGGGASGSRRGSGPPTPSRRCAGRSPRHARVVGVGRRDRRGAGQRQPSASAIAVMVEAVPMVMQCAGERAMPPSSISSQSASGDVAGAQLVPVLPGVAPLSPASGPPVAAQHRPGRHEDRRQVPALIAPMISPAWSCRSRPSARRRRAGGERSSSSVSIASRLR
jgi:hypothetical protein